MRCPTELSGTWTTGFVGAVCGAMLMYTYVIHAEPWGRLPTTRGVNVGVVTEEVEMADTADTTDTSDTSDKPLSLQYDDSARSYWSWRGWVKADIPACDRADSRPSTIVVKADVADTPE